MHDALTTHREYIVEPLLSTFARLQDPDSVMLAGGVAGVAAGAFIPDAFFWLFLLLLATNLLDWLLGRHSARAAGRYDRTRSRNGLVGKAAQLGIVLILRSLEAILTIAVSGIPSTMGLASAAVALMLVVEDVESVERHGIELGGGPVPGLSAVLDKLRAITGSERRGSGDGEAAPPTIGERRNQRTG